MTVKKGKPVTFTIKVTNTGEVALHNVRVTDAAAPSCARTIGNLAPGASVQYHCTLADVRRNVRNVAVVRGTTPERGSGGRQRECDGKREAQAQAAVPAAAAAPVQAPQAPLQVRGHDGHHKPCPPRPPHPHLPNTGGSPLGVLVAGFGATAGGALLSGMWFVRRRRAQLR